MKRSSTLGCDDTSKKSKPMDSASILRHQNLELSQAMKLAKEEVKSLVLSQQDLSSRLKATDSRFSALSRAWKALNVDLVVLADQVGDLPPHQDSRRSHALSKFVLAPSTTEGDESSSSSEEDDEKDFQAEGGEFEQELASRLSWTKRMLDKVASNRGMVVSPTMESKEQLLASPELLAARIELLEEKLRASKRQASEFAGKWDEEKMTTWRLTRRLATMQTFGEHSTTTANGEEAQMPLVANGEETPRRSSSPAYQEEISQLRFQLEEAQDLAASRLVEVGKVREQNLVLLRQATQSRPRSPIAPSSLKSDQQVTEEVQRSNRIAALAEVALEKLRLAEQKIGELEKVTAVIAQASENGVRKENLALRGEIESLRNTMQTQVVLLETAKPRLQAFEYMSRCAAQLDEEKRTLQAKLSAGGEATGEDFLLSEIESLNQALNEAREANTLLLSSSDAQIRQLLAEKGALERDVRERQEEKSVLVQQTEKMQQFLSDNEAHIALLKERYEKERLAAERSEELARSSGEACERALVQYEMLKSQLDRGGNEEEEKKSIFELESALAGARVELETLTGEHNRLKEEASQSKRRLERAKKVVEDLQKDARKSRTAFPPESATASSSEQEVRLQAMSQALRCPVYPNLWKDCVITKCAHMFSRRCLDDNLANRNRRCPTCKNQYSKDDLLNLYLYQSN